MRTIPSLTTAAALVAVTVACAEQRSTGNTEQRLAPSGASTAAVEERIATVEPREAIRIELGSEERKRTVEGRTSAAAPGLVTWSAPVGDMVSVRLSSPGNRARLVVFQPGSEEPVRGTLPEQGAIAWIGTQARGGEMRFEARTESAEEIPFRISVEQTPSLGVDD